MVKCDEDMKKQDKDETMIDMNAALYLRKVIREYTNEKVWVRREIETIRYELRFILAMMESYYS
jgi:hypothetical protein